MALTTAKFNNEEPEIEQPESSDESTDFERLSTDEKLSILFQAGLDNTLAIVDLANICRAMVIDLDALKNRVSALEAQLNGD